MEMIGKFTVGLVMICVIGSVVLVLSPDGTAEKQVKTVVSLVMLLCFLYPFCSGIDFNFNPDIKFYSNTDLNNNLFEDSLKSRLISDFKSYLVENGVDVVDIEVDMHTSNENQIIIEQVTVLLKPADSMKIEAVQKMLKNKFGVVCNAEVKNEYEN